jgi:hypothetical protein
MEAARGTRSPRHSDAGALVPSTTQPAIERTVHLPLRVARSRPPRRRPLLVRKALALRARMPQCTRRPPCSAFHVRAAWCHVSRVLLHLPKPPATQHEIGQPHPPSTAATEAKAPSQHAPIPSPRQRARKRPEWARPLQPDTGPRPALTSHGPGAIHVTMHQLPERPHRA